jgi:hypothetical protein
MSVEYVGPENYVYGTLPREGQGLVRVCEVSGPSASGSAAGRLQEAAAQPLRRSKCPAEPHHFAIVDFRLPIANSAGSGFILCEARGFNRRSSFKLASTICKEKRAHIDE